MTNRGTLSAQKLLQGAWGIFLKRRKLEAETDFGRRIKIRGNHRREAVFLKQNELQLADRRVRRAGAVTDHRKGTAPLT